MLAVAVATSVTDLRDHLIPNRLLVWGLAASLAVHLVNAVVTVGLAYLVDAPLPWTVVSACAVSVTLNTGLGVVASLTLFFTGLWSAGDAKLAIVLALGQPAWVATIGPVPWAPVLVLLGNGLFVALAYLALEILVRGLPRVVRLVAGLIRERRSPLAGPDVASVARIGLGVVAVATSLGPLRQWLGSHAGAVLSGGPFFIFLVLFLLYKPLHRVTRTTAGLVTASSLLVASVCWSIWERGGDGLLEVGRSVAIAAAVLFGRGLLAASSRSFDTRRVPAAALAAGMVLVDEQVDRLEREERFQDAFLPVLGDLRGRRLDENYIENLREWQAHNAPDEVFTVRSPLPFAPALAVAVPVTAVMGRLMFLW